MIQSKTINIIVALALLIALTVSGALVVIGNNQKNQGSIESPAEYATKIFGLDIISIEIIADEGDWQGMLDNADEEPYIMADVIVNGARFQNVGVRPKGNSSLSQVARSDSDRYSFRLQFDKYIRGQTCFGLESFVVNNMLGDNTYMKEYVSYELMREIGVDAPYFGYADIEVNGQSQGLYLAVELYNDSYEQRIFGDAAGMLYNVKSMDMGGNKDGNQPGGQGGNPLPVPGGQNNPPPRAQGASQQMPGMRPDFPNAMGEQPFSPADGNARPEFSPVPNMDRTAFPPQPDGENSDADRGFAGRGGRGGSGGSLEYTGDDIENYGAIFNNAVGKGTKHDFQRVILALKALSEGEDIETYLDVDQILRYLAAHTIVVNLDSYSSQMAQNYYIYEREGQITILPWDYNLAWGGFQNGNASAVINFPIDTPVSGVEMSSRPLLEKLFANPEYLERYHSYLQQLIDNYFSNGKFAERINTLDAMISDYVKNDATAFCAHEDYKTALSAFITLGNLRAQSVLGQLDGSVPSTASGQKENPDQLISAGEVKLSDLGSMMGGKGGNNGDLPADRMVERGKDSFPGGMRADIDPDIMNKAMEVLRQANGEISDETKEKLLSLGLTAEQLNRLSVMGGGRFGEMEQMKQNRDIRHRSDMNAPAPQKAAGNDLILIGVLLLILISALLFAARLKKNY